MGCLPTANHLNVAKDIVDQLVDFILTEVLVPNPNE
jgi:hypothetical protein